MIPPPCSIRAAENRHVQAISGMRPGTVEHDGTSYEGAVAVGDETFSLGERGPMRVQSFEALIAKTAMPTPLAQGDLVTVDGRGFKIVEVGGHDEICETWHLRGTRTPGKDTA